MARKSLALLAALLALVFFGSVMCPPVDERGELPVTTVGDADTLPDRQAPAAWEGAVRSGDPPVVEEPPAPAVLEVRVVDHQGSLLDGALVDLERVSGTTTLARALSRSGVAAFRAPEPGDYQLHASMEGHVPVRGVPLTLPLAEDGAATELVLVPGAIVSGTVVGLDGEPVVFGEIVLRDADGNEQVLRAHGAGSFESGPLPAEAWRISWREHPHADIDPRLTYHTPLGPGARLELAFTVEAAGREAAPGRRIGVTEKLP